MSWLLSVYIGATIFGVGVTLIDLLGLFGGHEADHAGASGHDLADHEGFADHATFGHDAETHDAEVRTDTPDSGATPHGADAHGAEHPPSIAGPDRSGGRNALVGLLGALRNLIYFCLGFGPVGLFALATSGSVARALIWSIPIGGAALVGTRALRKFMRRELNSEISSSELLMEHGVVTVSIGAGELGKVRVKLGDLYVDRFARAASASAAIPVGSAVRITEVTDDCIYVEAE